MTERDEYRRMQVEVFDRDAWPSVPLAYEAAEKSRELMVARVDLAAQRAQSIMVSGLAIVVFAAQVRAQPLEGTQALAAWTSFIAATAAALAGQWWGTVSIREPRVLFDRWLTKSEWEFRKDAIFFAAGAVERMTEVCDIRWRCAVAAGACYAVTAAMFAWA